jgi:hypothetical protein
MVKKAARSEEIDLDEVLDGFDDAEVDSRRPKLKEGDYPDLIVETVKFKPGFHGLSFVIESKLGADAEGNEDKAGRKVSLTINGWDKKNQADRALGRGKAFIAACFGISPTSKQKWKELMKLVTTDNSKIAGKRFACLGVTIVPGEGEKKDFVNWEASEYVAPDEAT